VLCKKKALPLHEPEEEKQLIDLLSAIIVDTVLNKKSYEKKKCITYLRFSNDGQSNSSIERQQIL
jgi:hypothetical protein